MRKWAIIASIWLAAITTLAFGAVAFAHERSYDGHRNGGDHRSSHCEYEHGHHGGGDDECDD
ncbi:MAG: hypothetical protein M1309_03450 [Actinobacteria bacterium]|nr:hypothetical protein [Actinomycetota bacterium]